MAQMWHCAVASLVLACALLLTCWFLLAGEDSSSATSKQQVLLVIDMQNDYDVRANEQLYGEVQSPYCSNISSIVPAVNKVRRSQQWDKVVFTMDWIKLADMSSGQPFCIENTAGAGLLDGLWAWAGDLNFTKNQDDAFNSVTMPSPGFGLRGEGFAIGAASNQLIDVLAQLGFSHANTDLTFVGQMTDRCVMKTAIHARSLGFDVAVVEAATYTGSPAVGAYWSQLPAETLVLENATWMPGVYASRDTPGLQGAWDYMEAAGITKVPVGRRWAAEGVAPTSLASSRELISAVNASDLAQVRQLLELEGADVEYRTPRYGFLVNPTAVIVAAVVGDFAVVEYLVDHALADMDARTMRLYTPLLEAAWEGHTEILRFLQEHGADVEARSNDGSTALLSACHRGHLDIVRYLIETAGSNKEAKSNDGFTPLLYAAWQAHLDVVQYLVEVAHVDAQARTEQGLSMKELAIRSRNPELIAYATAHYPDFVTRIGHTLTSGMTALVIFSSLLISAVAGWTWTHAARSGNELCMSIETGERQSLLVEEVTDEDGFSPLGPRSSASPSVAADLDWLQARDGSRPQDGAKENPISGSPSSPSGGACLAAAHHCTPALHIKGLRAFRGLEVVATIVYPFGVCMELVTPKLWVPLVMVLYWVPASFAFGFAEVFHDPVLLIAVSEKTWHKVYAIIRTLSFFPLAMSLCLGGKQPERWLSPEKVWCDGPLSNDKARWFIDPEWDVWAARENTLDLGLSDDAPMLTVQIEEGWLFHTVFRQGVLVITIFWVVLALIRFGFAETEGQKQARVLKVRRIAREIDRDGLDGCSEEIVSRTRFAGLFLMGVRFEVLIVFLDIVYFDTSLVFCFLMSREYKFSLCLLTAVFTTLALQIGDLRSGPSPCAVVSATNDEVLESIEQGTHTRRLMRMLNREKSFEAPVSLAITSYGLPFGAHSNIAFVNALLSMLFSVYAVSTYLFEKVDMTAEYRGMEEISDSEPEEDSDAGGEGNGASTDEWEESAR